MTRRDLSARADELRTLLIFTALQAFLLTVNLNLLPMSAAEAGTLRAVQQLTGAAESLWTLRLLSALCAVASTILLDRLWMRHASIDTRQWVLQFWAFSPCLLLYGRMARPYSLQVLLTILAVWSLLRFVEQYRSPSGKWKRLAVLAASLGALSYALYVSGPLKLIGGLYSLAFGEAIPVWLLALSAVLAGPYLWILYRGARGHRLWLAAAAVAALLAYITGTSMLFLLPMLIVAVATGIGQSGRFGQVFAIALFAANAGGVWSYFQTRDILNPAYAAPYRQIAAAIVVRSSPADTVVLLDAQNLNDSPLVYYLPANFTLIPLRSPKDADAAFAELRRNSNIKHAWLLRSPQDFAPLVQQIMGAWYSHALHPYAPLPAVDRLAQRYLMHVAQPPAYLYEAWEFRR